MLSNWAWWILAASVFVALFIMLLAWIIVKYKLKKLQQKYQKPTLAEDLLRENSGFLLWELKAQAKNPLQDLQLEYLINTVNRNRFQTTLVYNSDSDYEAKTFKQIAKQKIVLPTAKNYDFAIIFVNQELNKNFDLVFKNLNPKGIVAIVNAIKKDREVKRLLSYLKLSGIRHERQKIGQGIILVAK